MMTQEQLAISYTDQVFQLIGAHGIVAILATIFLVRTIRVLWYLDKKESFIVNLIVSSIVGACSVYFFVEIHDMRAMLGGSFMTFIGSILAYELIKFGLGWLYERTRSETVRALFFFLSPKPIKTKKNGVREEFAPHSDLTRIFDKTRLDK